MLRKFQGDERGAIAILVAILLVALCGAAGISIDYSRALRLQMQMQLALDASILAVARLGESDRQDRAEAVFRENLGKADGTVSKPTLMAGPGGELTGTATGEVPTTFAALLGVNKLDISVETKVVGRGNSNPCILVLDPGSAQSLLVNSGAVIDAPDCEIDVKSTASPAAIFNASAALTTQRICIEGANIIDNGGAHPNTELSCKTVDDPYAGNLTHPASTTCDVNNANYSGANVTLDPGVYCGWINFNAGVDVDFRPGVYVVKNGGWNVNGGNWTGDGVVFYFADESKIQFNSAVKASLTPPTSGPYEGIIIFEKEGLTRSPFVLDDSQGFGIEGLIYLPSRDTTFNSASNMTSKSLTMVVNTLILDETNWNLTPAPKGIGASGGTKSVYLVK